MTDARRLFDEAPELPASATLPAGTLPLVRAEDRESWPLSHAQERLWFLEQLIAGAATYHEYLAWTLDGHLDLEALRWALARLVERHESLRTLYAMDERGLPSQRIAPTAICLQEEVVGNEAALTACTRAAVRRPYDLEREAPLRALLARYGQQHRLVLALHHLAIDRWSLQLLERELWELYGARVTGREPRLERLSTRYVDYALWQRQWSSGAEADAQLGYWRQQLAAMAPLQLPTDRPRPPVRPTQGATHAFELTEELTGHLRALSRAEGVTLYMTLLAAFKVLLGRYSGQEDVAVGSLISGRDRPEVRGLVGFFVNTLVMRTDLSGEPTFRQLVQRVKRTAVEAYRHQNLPFEKVVAGIAPPREPSRNPFFQVLFVLQQDRKSVV